MHLYLYKSLIYVKIEVISTILIFFTEIICWKVQLGGELEVEEKQ